MALSGTFYNNVGKHWRLQVEWSATQNVTANTSTITANMYWIGLTSYSATYTSTTKDGAIVIDGTTYTFSGAGLAKLSSGQKKLIATKSKTVTHGSDGSKRISLGGYFDVDLTLDGTYWNRINLPTQSIDLNNIARASTLALNSQASWVAGNEAGFGISRSSSSFTHTLNIRVAGTLIKTLTGVTTSSGANFTSAEHKKIFTALSQSASAPTAIEVLTYSGSTLIGTRTVTGTVTAPANSVTYHNSMSNFVDQTLSIGIAKYHDSFTHTVRVKLGSYTKTFTGMTGNIDWTPTSAEQASMYAQMPNDSIKDGVIEVDTFYEGIKVRSTHTATVQYKVRNSNPVFDVSAISYSDNNSASVNITGNNQSIIQGVSNVIASIALANKATAVNGATMSSYTVTLNGVQKTAYYSSTSNLAVDMGKVSSAVDVTLAVRAIDSRGNSTEVNKTVKILPYSTPTVMATAKRKNNFEADTTVTLKGTLSSLASKNSITQAKMRYKDKTSSTWGAYVNFSQSLSGANYTATNRVITLDNTKSYDVEVYVADKLTNRTVLLSVASGKPIFFIDSKKRSVGVNAFPTANDSFEVDGNVKAKDISANNLTSINGVTGTNITANGQLTAFGTAYLYSGLQAYGNSYLNGNTNITGNLNVSGDIQNEERIVASLVNSWSNYSNAGGAYSQASYWKDKNGVVHLTGFIQGGLNSPNTNIFTLPVGYRPLGHEVVSAFTNDANKGFTMRININSQGSVQIGGTYTTWISLAGISFKAEQ